MTPGRRRGLGILIVTALAVGGFVMAKRADLERQLVDEQAVTVALESELAAAEHNGARGDGRLADARETTSTYALLLRERAEFVTALEGVSAAFASAQGKVDTKAERAKVIALQEDVLAEREDASVIVDAVKEVGVVAASVKNEVAAYDEEQRQLALAQAPGFGGSAPAGVANGGAYGRVRAALDAVGGRGVTLQEYTGACGGITAAACASPSGVILYTGAIAGWSTGRLNWVMAHELAHIHQFRVWNTLVSSAGYASLFGGDIELLANCMAQQRGFPSGNVWCSGAQLSWAGAVWGGVVPG